MNWIEDNTEKIFISCVVLFFLCFIAYAVYYFQPITGEIADKQFIPAHTEIRYNENCITITVDKNSTVRNCTQIPYTVFISDAWWIKVCNKDRCKQIKISQIKYDDMQIGNHFSEENK